MEQSNKKRTRKRSRKKIVTRTSPLKGRKIDKSKRSKTDPKFGPKFKYGVESEKHTITLSLRPGTMQNVLKELGLTSKAKAVVTLINDLLGIEKD